MGGSLDCISEPGVRECLISTSERRLFSFFLFFFLNINLLTFVVLIIKRCLFLNFCLYRKRC